MRRILLAVGLCAVLSIAGRASASSRTYQVEHPLGGLDGYLFQDSGSGEGYVSNRLFAGVWEDNSLTDERKGQTVFLAADYSSFEASHRSWYWVDARGVVTARAEASHGEGWDYEDSATSVWVDDVGTVGSSSSSANGSGESCVYYVDVEATGDAYETECPGSPHSPLRYTEPLSSRTPALPDVVGLLPERLPTPPG